MVQTSDYLFWLNLYYRENWNTLYTPPVFYIRFTIYLTLSHFSQVFTTLHCPPLMSETEDTIVYVYLKSQGSIRNEGSI